MIFVAVSITGSTVAVLDSFLYSESEIMVATPP